MKRDARISQDKKYRYLLRREWDPKLPPCLFIMLNPSTADAGVDDPTIKRVIGFSTSWGFGSALVGNLFAVRSPSPQMILDCDDPVGPDNKSAIEEMVRELYDWDFPRRELKGKVICAWGSGKMAKFMDQDQTMIGWLQEFGVDNLHTIQTNGTNRPVHPLYLLGSLKPKRWKP